MCSCWPVNWPTLELKRITENRYKNKMDLVSIFFHRLSAEYQLFSRRRPFLTNAGVRWHCASKFQSEHSKASRNSLLRGKNWPRLYASNYLLIRLLNRAMPSNGCITKERVTSWQELINLVLWYSPYSYRWRMLVWANKYIIICLGFEQLSVSPL
jgi:hypothetical protein